jgi:hypothetical protein
VRSNHASLRESLTSAAIFAKDDANDLAHLMRELESMYDFQRSYTPADFFCSAQHPRQHR